MKQFKDKYGPWAVVTGASSGIGRAIAKQLAKSGLNLVLVGRSVNSLDQFSVELRELASHSKFQVLALDLADHGCIETLLSATSKLDVGLLVASAGFGSSGAFLENPIEPELEMLQVNCRALMELTWHYGNSFSKRGGGGIILLSSIVSYQGAPWSAHYSATKAYVQTLAEGLRTELRAKKIDVLSVAPGPTKTGFANRAGMKMGSALDPESIAPEILSALGRRTTVLPGFLSKLLVYSMGPLPRWLRIAIMGHVMKSMAMK